jgi:hypothetical protein
MFATSSTVAGALDDRTRPVRPHERGGGFLDGDAGLFRAFLEHRLDPSDSVGPGRTAFTVTPLPAMRLARPREIASSTVLVKP